MCVHIVPQELLLPAEKHTGNMLLVQSERWFYSLLFSFNIQIFTYYIILKQNILGFSVGCVIQVLLGTWESGPLITMAF